MHEVSLVRNILKTLEQEFDAQDLDNLTAIDLKVGLLSNVEPILMQNAFEAVKEAERKYESVKLNIEVVPIVIYCDKCGKEHTVQNYVFKCDCGIPCSNVIKGTELLIHQVHFAENERDDQDHLPSRNPSGVN